MAIINATPHAIVIFAASAAEFNKEQRKLLLVDGAEPLRVIPPSGELLNARMGSEPGYPIEGIPTKRSVVLGADPIPAGDDYFVVSRLYLAAAKEQGWDTSRLLCVADPVYVLDGPPQPKGCLGFERN